MGNGAEGSAIESPRLGMEERAPAGRYARTGEPREILVDPAVSRAKFERELREYQGLEANQRAKGWWVLRAEYPEVLVVFVATQLRPPAVAFGALLDFNNYDLWPPSVTIVDPFTSRPLLDREIPPNLHLQRRVGGQLVQIPGVGAVPTRQELALLQAHEPSQVPFLCLPGVREYHEHPGHSGDPWLQHRGKGEGTLFFLLEKLYRYGVEPIRAYQIGMNIAGFVRSEAPE